MTLNDKILKRIREQQKNLDLEGNLKSNAQLAKYYENFLKHFGPEKFKDLDGEALLETIHDHGNRESLVYWLEFKDDDEFPAIFGSIAGGSALKFGIYRRKETGAWTTGTPQNQRELPIEEAISIARTHRDQLLKGAELLDKLPMNATDLDYLNLQHNMDDLAPAISNLSWGHKYLSLLYPGKLDDYHSPDYQRFHLIKLLQIPPQEDGRYVCAGRYVSIASELGMSLNNLTTVLNSLNGSPYQYWRIGTTRGLNGNSEWKYMRDGGYIAIGWEELGDISYISNDRAGKEKIREKISTLYPDSPGTATKQANQVFNFVFGIKEGDLVLACSGMEVLGVGKVAGGYTFKEGPNFPHRRPVEWFSLDPWDLPEKEGLMTTLAKLKIHANLVEAESRILDMSPLRKHQQLDGLLGRIQSALERKGQIILYGPPGTGKTYLAEKATHELAAIYNFNKGFSELSDEQRNEILGNDKFPGIVRMCSFHPAYGYEDFLEGYKPEVIDSQMTFKLKDGIFKKLCGDAQENPHLRFYLIIDEINRGDIPRIFGELITILEKNKRGKLGKPITLPLSREQFQVPDQIYIIGTMNTADRSIALLDTALRRRFGFIEIMPDSSILGSSKVEGIPLGPWLNAINRQICANIGRDARNLQIGHSYLLEKGRPISDFSTFSRVIREDIIPLLEEYCYEDYSALEKILGKGLVDVQDQRIRNELFEESHRDDLIQALKTPFPEMFTSLQVQESENEEPEEELAGSDTISEEKVDASK